jgi:hypothetical protein
MMDERLLKVLGSTQLNRGTWRAGVSDRLMRALVLSFVLLGFAGCSVDTEVGEANPMSLYQSTQPGIPSLIRLDRAESALNAKVHPAASTLSDHSRE